MGGCYARCLAAVLALVCSIAVASAQQSAVVTGVHLSDLHVDPFFGTENAERADCNTKEAPWYGLPGCDTSPAMMRAALGDVATTMAATNASVLYYTGDWLRHDMKALKANASDIGLSIFLSIASAFADIARKVKVVAHPAVPVSLGNEDFIPDYHFNISADGEPVDKGAKSLLKGMASILATTGLLNASQAKTFSYCGYTSQHVEVSSSLTLRVISLNTLIWSKKLKPKTTAKDPCGQFAWFETELAKAKANGEMVHVLSHIFPDVLLWDSTHIDAYKGLLEQYSDVVQAQFFGHIHRMSYIVQNPGLFGAARMPTIHVGGPITRASSTNPDYALVSLDSTTGAVVDRVQRYFNSSSQSWVTGSSLRDILRLASLASPADLVAASTRLMNTSDATANADFQRFWQLFQGGMTTEACTGLCQKAIMCSTVSLDVWDILAECKILFGAKSDTDDDNHRRQREIMVKLFSE